MPPTALAADWRHARPSQVARILGATSGLVYAAIKSGELEAVSISNGTSRPTYRVSREAFEKFLAARKVKPQADSQANQ